MQQRIPETDAKLKAIQEREKSLMLQLSLCNQLCSVTTKTALVPVITGLLHDNLPFDSFVICVADAAEKEYNIFFHDDEKSQSELKGTPHFVADGFFDTALQSADPVVFNLLNLSAKNTPVFIARARQVGMREAVAFPLHYHKNNPSVVFMFYKRQGSFDRNAERLLKSISLQMALTISNILLTQKLNNHTGTPSNFKDQVIEQQQETHNPDTIFTDVVAKSDELQEVFKLVSQVAPSDSGVLLLGESGTGKEVIASAIHNLSPLKNRNMIRVNCAAIPENLIESELFGHEKGSFTGATERRKGKFELANNSTLFLDEIGELPLNMQTKLLRVLQENEFERIGSSRTIKVKVRIIAATNRNLFEEMAGGRFRSDLFYRLNVFPIVIPPLRERKSDIQPLSNYFIDLYCSKSGKKPVALSPKVLEAMMIYTWPGNVRELKHAIERSILLSDGKKITKMHFPEMTSATDAEGEKHPNISLLDVEKAHILKVIKLCNGRISGPNGAAARLGVPPTTLASKMQKLGISKKHTF
ncbi:AAA family ATPase [Flavobacterium zepuense]|uniref:AAA family ATPase n=1 Tax=Flavobacterium zepuense TaxID=2593302 RepID=A0A552V621_9FLAO|nr:sigma 54-interacting transcriptional regulator [Flavobacterium zepuense]TRW25897.1 AAA family ATPase [Flavobacterium zepuense]